MKKTLSAILILMAVFVFGQKRALDFETFFTLQRASGLALSPDGRFAALVLRQASLDDNKMVSRIALFDLINKKLTFLKGEANQTAPAFVSASQLSFITRSAKGQQLHLLDLKKEEVKELTSVPEGLSNYIWVKPLETIAFTAEIFPQFTKLEESLEFEKSLQAKKTTGKIFRTIPFRIWNSYKDDKYSNLFLHKIGTADFQNLTPGAYDTPPVDLGGKIDYSFSPDGKYLAYVKNTDPLIAISTNNDVFLKDLSSGSEINLTAENKGNDCYPQFFASGRYLAYLSMPRAGFEADQRFLIIYDLKLKKYENLTKDIDLSVNDYQIADDGSVIYFTAEEGIYHNLFSINLKTKKISRLISNYNISEFRYHPASKNIYFLAQSALFPNELFVWNGKSRKVEKLSAFNAEKLADIEMNGAETFQFSGANNEKVEGVMVKPPFFDPNKKYPLAFLIHGGPQGAWSDEFHFRWNYQMFAQAGFVVVGINFHGSTGYGQKFTDSISGEWGGLPFEDLVKGQAFVVENYKFIDPEKIVAAGASYGGFMINWIAGHHQDFKYPFRALVSHSGIFDSRSMYYSTEELWFEEWEHKGTPWTSDLFEKWNPANFVTNFKIPMLVVHGENDFRVPVSQGMMLFTALQRLGIESKMLYFPDEDHFVQKPHNARLWWETVLEWCQRHIK